jgi:hypothetical protein
VATLPHHFVALGIERSRNANPVEPSDPLTWRTADRRPLDPSLHVPAEFLQEWQELGKTSTDVYLLAVCEKDPVNSSPCRPKFGDVEAGEVAAVTLPHGLSIIEKPHMALAVVAGDRK